MSNIRIKALKPFTLRDVSTGALQSIACGQVAEFGEIGRASCRERVLRAV